MRKSTTCSMSSFACIYATEPARTGVTVIVQSSRRLITPRYLPTFIHTYYYHVKEPITLSWTRIYMAYCSFGGNGSTFQIISAYSSIHLSELKKPMRATVVMHFVIHSS